MRGKTGFRDIPTNELFKQLKTDPANGLSEKEAMRRLERYGPNVIRTAGRPSPLAMFLRQFMDFSVLTLLAAALISLSLGELADAITIIAIVVINAVLGFLQEFKAEKAVEALSQLTCPKARVYREGNLLTVDADMLVPGDIVRVEVGDIVPADCRVFKSYNLAVEESCLTGETLPNNKMAMPGKDALFMGTTVVRGSGLAIVVTTGSSTEIGKVAQLIAESGEVATPLQVRLEKLSKMLVAVCLTLCLVLVLLGLRTGETPYRIFLAGVSLAVAAIPEGLPAVVTVALTLGVQRMAGRNAIVRKLPAVETLGCTTVICSDKTGTLTQNQMTVKQIVTATGSFSVSGDGLQLEGEFIDEASGNRVDPGNHPELRLALLSGLHCNNSSLKLGKNTMPSGDPTEVALLVAAAKAEMWKPDFRAEDSRTFEFPFEPERRMMSVVTRINGQYVVFAKGAADTILRRSTTELVSGSSRPLTQSRMQWWLGHQELMVGKAMRVLALAYKVVNTPEPDQTTAETSLTLIGLAGIMDPPREEARESIQTCKAAGITTLMLTGDHPLTAVGIARAVGLCGENDRVITGEELDGMSPNELEKCLKVARVFARVTPAHKLRIVKALKRMKHVVAMTGDGVNDAPAINEADIGIAMGLSGTEVAREASHMVLADDNFATIVAAVAEGRTIYDNIKKFVKYLVSCNVGEVLTMFVAVLARFPLPLLPIQVLWVNLVTDGLPAMALGVDPPSEGIMNRPPRGRVEPIIAPGESFQILGRGLLISLATLLMFLYGLQSGSLAVARTMAFSTLVFSQLVYSFECRAEGPDFVREGLVRNPLLALAVLTSIVTTALVVYNPSLNKLFSTVPLSPKELTWVVLASSPTLIRSVLNRLSTRLRLEEERA